jgi:hypothetical protein
MRGMSRTRLLARVSAARTAVALSATAFLSSLAGCAVITVVDTAASIAVSGVGLAVDAGVGVVKITGKAVGAAADAIIPGGEEK